MNKNNSVPGNYYDQGIKNNFFQRLWHLKRFKLITELVKDSRGIILDVGCAGGLFTAQIGGSGNFTEIYGVDISHSAINYARKRHPDYKFFVANIYQLPFKNQTFDLTTCLEVLEHVNDPVKALTEIRRCLKSNGLLIILVPTDSILFRLIWFFWTKGKGKIWQGTHVQQFSKEKLKGILKEAGFKIIQEKASHLGMLLAIKAKKN